MKTTNTRVCKKPQKTSFFIGDDGDRVRGPDLVTIIEAWPQLPEAVKADNVAMVRVSRK